MKKIFFILSTIFLFSSCIKYDSKIAYRVERPYGTVHDTINYVTFNSKCMVTCDDGNFVLNLNDKVNHRTILVSKYPIVIESFQKVQIN